MENGKGLNDLNNVKSERNYVHIIIFNALNKTQDTQVIELCSLTANGHMI